MGSKSALEEMLEEYLNPRPKTVEAAEDLIGGGATVMPYHEDFQAVSASKGKNLRKKAVKEALPLRAADSSMGARYLGSKVSRKDLAEEGWEVEESSEEDEDEEDEKDSYASTHFDHDHDGAMEEDEDDDEEEEGMENGGEEDGDEADEESEEEIVIGNGNQIVIKQKGSPGKRKRDAEDDDEDDEVDGEAGGDEEEGEDDEDDDDDDKDEDEGEDMDGLGIMGEAEQQEDEAKLEKELQRLKREEKEAVTSIKSDNRKELEKALHTKNQKLLWNSFMELRISFQQMLNLANRFPRPEAYSLFVAPQKLRKRKNKKQKTDDGVNGHPEPDPEQEENGEADDDDEKSEALKEGLEDAASSLASLFDGLFSAKKALLGQNESFAPVLKGASREVVQPDDELALASGDYEDGGARTNTEPKWEEFVTVEEDLWKKTDEVIERWNRKTMLSQGIVQKEFKAINRTVLNQISQLMSDRERLVKRTQLKRSSAKVFGAALYPKKATPEAEETPGQVPNGVAEGSKRKGKDEEYDEEAFDDSDFYHQLLRELVESGNANVTDPIALGRSYAQLRRMLRKNKKKDVDQKASKGRKLRYDVMAPLVNYMPAITTTQQVTPMAEELFSHLFSS